MPRTLSAPAQLFLPLPVGVLCCVFLGEKPKQHAWRSGDGESSCLLLFLSHSVCRPRPGLNSFSRASSSSPSRATVATAVGTAMALDAAARPTSTQPPLPRSRLRPPPRPLAHARSPAHARGAPQRRGGGRATSERTGWETHWWKTHSLRDQMPHMYLSLKASMII
uniref:Uncharacterized protein n=1 Tax=Oryza meridionalis TaxID=40149 RepID=A0A0E0ES52_9ORYZ